MKGKKNTRFLLDQEIRGLAIRNLKNLEEVFLKKACHRLKFVKEKVKEVGK